MLLLVEEEDPVLDWIEENFGNDDGTMKKC